MWLQGIRVLDLTRLISGPVATRVLADFGAEVIKVQSKKISTGMEDPSHPFFRYLNRNKKSITLNLQHPAAIELFLKLVEKSDLIVENFSPRVMENLGLGYEILSKRNPKIIMISMSSMGRNGPWSNFVCLSHTFHALSGLTHLTCRELSHPRMIGFSYADFVFGLYAAILALSALIWRERTKKGCFIDLSGYETTVTLLGKEILKLSEMENACACERVYPSYVVFPVGVRRTFCVACLHSEADFKKLLKLIGHQGEQDFHSVRQSLSSWAKKKTLKQVEDVFKENGIFTCRVREAASVLRDRNLQRKGLFIQRSGSTMISSPLRTLLKDRWKWNEAPDLGEHNNYVYCHLLKLSAEELQRNIKEGVVF